MSKKKKRPPIEQLLEAGRTATKMLVERGLQAEDSILDKMAQDPNMPLLPGLPTYLPREWTIKATQRILYDLLIIWKDNCRGDVEREEDVIAFFKFIVKELRIQEKRFDKDTKRMGKMIKTLRKVPVIKEIFAPMRQKENTYAIQRFLVDSFAVAVILKQSNTVSDFANWFLDWSNDLYSLWVRKDGQPLKLKPYEETTKEAKN